jgi:hypothetical protein
MNRTTKLVGAAGAAATLIALTAGFGTGAATGSSASSATYEMYANVDAEGDLGSNYDAVSVKLVADTYLVKFSHSIGSCAAVVQPGKAGGPDPVKAAESTVIPLSDKTFGVQFVAAALGNVTTDPFMLTVTCKS